jgi:hypothetical protein
MLETKIAWISKIETRDDALEVVKIASIGFFFFAGLQFVLFLVTNSPAAFGTAAVLVAGAVALVRHSRAAAAVLLALSVAEALVTVAHMFGAPFGRGSNIFLAGLMVWVAVRAVQATWALQRMPDDEDDEEPVAAAPRR